MKAAVNWSAIDLVVFDVDGTLYDQARLRWRMLIELGRYSCRTLSLATALTLRDFRRCRELLSSVDDGVDFVSLQYGLTAERRRMPADEVRRTVEDWLEARPLPFLRVCRFHGVAELFAACVHAGKKIAVWSDYPAAAKLEALGLAADIVVSSAEDGVRRLKPNPAGLREILSRTGVPPERAILIGDRVDHDGEAARRAGVTALLRRDAPLEAFMTFANYHDPVFHPLLDEGALQ